MRSVIASTRSSVQISVIVPTLNEEQHLARLLQRLETLPHIGEIVVCDGGSVDATTEVARRFGALVVETSPNRGAQMNAGVRLSQGEVLWFLHADSCPAKSSTRNLLSTACDENVVGGNFRLRFETRSRGAHLVENIARVLRFFGVYYGDSGIWLRRETFDQLGGYQNWPLFEDFDLARKMERLARRRGHKTVCLAAPLIVSSRRFKMGTMRLLWRWLSLQIAFWRGVSPDELAQRYRKS